MSSWPSPTGRNEDIGGLAWKVRALTENSSEIVYIPYEQAYEEGFEDMPRRVPDIAKLKRYVGYEPKVQLEEMIEKVVAYYWSIESR